jgi:hypothetical protein
MAFAIIAEKLDEVDLAKIIETSCSNPSTSMGFV